MLRKEKVKWILKDCVASPVCSKSVISTSNQHKYVWSLQKQVWVSSILSTFQVGVATFQVLEFAAQHLALVWPRAGPGTALITGERLCGSEKGRWCHHWAELEFRPMWSPLSEGSLSDTNHRPAHFPSHVSKWNRSPSAQTHITPIRECSLFVGGWGFLPLTC